MRLNEYPKEELQELFQMLGFCREMMLDEPSLEKWNDRVKEAIRDAEFEDKQLPFRSVNELGEEI